MLEYYSCPACQSSVEIEKEEKVKGSVKCPNCGIPMEEVLE